MGILDKLKNLSGRAKIIAVTSLVIANLATATAGAYAWFSAMAQTSNISTVSGDLNVSIEKVTAYKYVYPYYSNSAEFIDYDSPGQVLSFVLEDKDVEDYVKESLSADRAVFEDDVVFTLGENVAGTYVTSGTGTRQSILRPEGNDFYYYLVGDGVFAGSSAVWSLGAAIPFSFSGTASALTPAQLDGVVVSAGAEFTLFDTRTASAGACTYLDYDAYQSAPASGKSKRFEIIDEDGRTTLRCLCAGIYSFVYDGSTLSIALHNRSNDAIIGSNLLDPTKISLDYYASQSQGTLEEYIPTAVAAQNTMVILDVLLHYRNVSEVDAGLKVLRTSDATFDYASTTENVTGYISESEGDRIGASHFYAFYSLFSQTALGTSTEVYAAMHAKTTDQLDASDVPYFSKFATSGSSIEVPLHSDSETIENGKAVVDISTSSGADYHCYVAIEYDHVYTRYFMNEARMGKSYRLDRDFGFYFTATQHRESEVSSQ